MVIKITLILMLALTWVALTGKVALPTFVMGLLLGCVIVELFGRRATRVLSLHVHHIWPLIQLCFIFVYELVMANLSVLVKVFSPKLNIKPGIIKVPIDIEGAFWITTLANMVTLTPGTLTVEVAPDNKYFYVHCLNIDDEAKTIASIKDTFEKKILEVCKP